MRLVAVNGKNNKKYIQICDVTTSKDLLMIKALDTVVSRTEYKPFSRGFDKNIRDSYLINNTYIPSTFIQEITQKFLPLYPGMTIENQEILYNTKINKNDFQEWLESLPLPDKYNTVDEKYIYQPESAMLALFFKTARIEVGTGGGKTFITYLYCRYLIDNNLIGEGKRILIIVPRKTLVNQTVEEINFADQYNDNKLVVETIYSGSKRVANSNVVIGTYHSLREYDKEYFEDFGAVLCDEAHGSKTYSIKTEIYNKIENADYLFGMTGTWPEPKTLDYLHVVSMWGPLVLVKKTWQLIEDGNVVPVYINAIRINYKNTEYKDFSKNLKLSEIIGTEKFRAEKAFFQNLTERTNIMVKLIGHFDDNHLILVDTVEYAEQLQLRFADLFEDRICQLIHGKISNKNRDAIITEMKSTPKKYLLFATYETMSTGISIPTINHVHFPDGGKSTIRIKQSYGRGLRLDIANDKTHLNVWDYQDDMMQSCFRDHAKVRNLIYTAERIPIQYTDFDLIVLNETNETNDTTQTL